MFFRACNEAQAQFEISGDAGWFRDPKRSVTSLHRPFMGRTYLDVQMGDISLMEVGESFH